MIAEFAQAIAQAPQPGLKHAILTHADAISYVLIAAGLLAQIIHRKLPSGLGTSMFVGTVSLAAGLMAATRGATAWNLYSACHITSTLCVLWAVMGWFSSLFSWDDPSPTRPRSSAVFFAWAMVAGVAGGVLTLNTLVGLTLSRVLNPSWVNAGIPSGKVWWDIVALLIAVLVWTLAGRNAKQPVMVLILSAMLVWWSGLMIPDTAHGAAGMVMRFEAFRPAWWNWVIQLQVGLSCVVLTAAVFQDVLYRNRQKRAWPDRLAELAAPYSRWPLFIQVEAMIAAAVLILGVYVIVRREPLEWPAALTGFAASTVTGVVCFFMTYRRWSANTAALGIGLLTLASALFACWAGSIVGGIDEADAYADRIPVTFNAVLFALAIMFFYWRWLAAFWRQQLLGKEPWTTTGRLIPYARRGAFVIAALAMLTAFQMALWPEMVPTSGDDGGWRRILAGLLAIGLVVLIAAKAAMKDTSSSMASLCVAVVVAGVAFVFVRFPPSATRGWVIQYHAVVFAALVIPILIAAEAVVKSKARCFETPLWMLSMLILPGAALVALLSPVALPAQWIRPATLGLVGVAYCLAGRREHRRAFLVLGAVLLIAAASSGYNAYGSEILARGPDAVISGAF